VRKEGLELMKAVCAWCKKSLGYRPYGDASKVTHGICKDCKKTFERRHNRKLVNEIKSKLDVLWQYDKDHFYLIGSQIMDHILSKLPDEIPHDIAHLETHIPELRKGA